MNCPKKGFGILHLPLSMQYPALTEADAFNGLHLYVCMDGWMYYVFMYVSLETSVCGDSGYGFVVCLLIINSCGLSTQTTAAS